jgi:hypothetical protein
MTPELTAFYERGVAAERVGDLEEALEYHSGIPMFSRGRHHAMLEQLVAVEDDLPSWAWVRWIVYLALRSEDPGTLVGRRHRRGLLEAVELFHADLMDAAYDEGDDPVRVTAQVLGESWACHQSVVHDHHVLDIFLDHLVGGKLAEHATLAREWVGARMGGYRIEGRTSACTLVARDLADRQTVEVLDLGAGCLAGPHRTVIGRLVPSGTTPEAMFDIAPLPLDEQLATEVARTGADDTWSDVLADAIEDARLDPASLLREDYELLTDVPSLDLLTFGTQATDLARVMTQLRQGRDEIGRAAFRILRSASEGSLGEASAPYVAAACLNVHAYEDARRRILAPGQRGQWLRWAELVPQPARARLLTYAEATADAA